ncbi:MAG: ABC transporter ATP-binding protein [Syntrophobacteria bacterium]
MALLKLQSVSKQFGELWALKDIEFSMNEGEIVGLVGPNGAGKTTLFNVITGRSRPDGGRIFFKGKDITCCKPDEICRLGISRTFQSSRPFARMTSLDNVVVGRVFGNGFRPRTRPEDIEEAGRLLEVVGIAHKAQTLAADLTLSEQRRLDLARALATEPSLLLLDEVAAGFSPAAVKQAVDLIRRVRQRGVALFIIDHFLNLSLRVSDRLLALEHGKKITEGKPQVVMRNPEVIRAYLGMQEENSDH